MTQGCDTHLDTQHQTAIQTCITVNSACYRPESCDCWITPSPPVTTFPSVLVWSSSKPRCSDPGCDCEQRPGDVHVLPQYNGRNSSVEPQEKEDITSCCCVLILSACQTTQLDFFFTWQVWLGRKTGLIRSAVVLFPLTGKIDRKCAKEERVKCGGAAWINRRGCEFRMAISLNYERLTWCVVGVVMVESWSLSCSEPSWGGLWALDQVAESLLKVTPLIPGAFNTKHTSFPIKINFIMNPRGLSWDSSTQQSSQSEWFVAKCATTDKICDICQDQQWCNRDSHSY